MTPLPPEVLAEYRRQAREAPPPSEETKARLRALMQPLPEPMPAPDAKAS